MWNLRVSHFSPKQARFLPLLHFLTLQIKVQKENARCVIIWSQLSLAPWNIVSGARAAPLDWSQDVLFSGLSFSHFFSPAPNNKPGLVSRDGGLCAGYVAAVARPRSPLHISQLSEIIRLSSSRWTFLTHTHIQLGAVKERKSRLMLIAAQSFLCVRVQSAFFVCASGLASQHSAFIKRGMCVLPTGSIQISRRAEMVFLTFGCWTWNWYINEKISLQGLR